MRVLPLVLLLSSPWLSACATAPRRGTLDTLKPAVETFHQRIRWRDYRGASELLIDERRGPFLEARKVARDDRDLSVTDYQLEDVRLAPDGQTAQVTSRLGWVRLPSVSEKSDLVTSEWAFRKGTWYLARQDSGPFAPELLAPLAPPDGGR